MGEHIVVLQTKFTKVLAKNGVTIVNIMSLIFNTVFPF